MSRKKHVLRSVIAVGAIIGVYLAYDMFMFVHNDNAQIEGHTLILSPKVSGFIAKVNQDMGDVVKAGDVLLEIEERDYALALDRAKAEYASTEAKFQDAQKTMNRIVSLYSKGAMTLAANDQAVSSFNDLKAKAQSLAASVSQAELNLANTKIRAPFDGIVAKRSAEVGQFVGSGTPLFGFVGISERWVIANFKETDISNIKIGADVDIEVDAIKGKTWHGKIQQLNPTTGAKFSLIPPDNATGNFTKVVQRLPVKISIDQLATDDMNLLKAGLSCAVKVHKR